MKTKTKRSNLPVSIKNIFSVNWWKDKAKFNISVLNKAIFAIIIICSIGYVASINDLIVKGFRLQELKNQAYELQEDNRQKRNKVMAMESYNTLNQKASKMDMVAVGEEIDYIVITPSVVAQK